MDARRRNKHATVAIPFALIQSGCSWKCILLICKVFLLAHLSVWRGLVYAWLLMAKLRYKTQTKSTLKGSLNLNRSSNSAIVAVFYHFSDAKQIYYFDIAFLALYHCVALFCFQKQQKQHLKIIEQGVSHQKYVFVFTEDTECAKLDCFPSNDSISLLLLVLQTELTSESRVAVQSQLSELGRKQVRWPALTPQSCF